MDPTGQAEGLSLRSLDCWLRFRFFTHFRLMSSLPVTTVTPALAAWCVGSKVVEERARTASLPAQQCEDYHSVGHLVGEVRKSIPEDAYGDVGHRV